MILVLRNDFTTKQWFPHHVTVLISRNDFSTTSRDASTKQHLKSTTQNNKTTASFDYATTWKCYSSTQNKLLCEKHFVPQNIAHQCERTKWPLMASMALHIIWQIFYLLGIHSMQGWTATTRHRVIGKRSTKRLQHTGNLFRRNLQLKSH